MWEGRAEIGTGRQGNGRDRGGQHTGTANVEIDGAGELGEESGVKEQPPIETISK